MLAPLSVGELGSGRDDDSALLDLLDMDDRPQGLAANLSLTEPADEDEEPSEEDLGALLGDQGEGEEAEEGERKVSRLFEP